MMFVTLTLILMETFLNSLSKVVDKAFCFGIATNWSLRRRWGFTLRINELKMTLRNYRYFLFGRLLRRFALIFFEFSQTCSRWKSSLLRFFLDNFQRFILFTFEFFFNFYLLSNRLLVIALSRFRNSGLEQTNFSLLCLKIFCIIAHRLIYHLFQLDYLFPHGVLNLPAFVQLCLQKDSLLERPIKEGTDATYLLFNFRESAFFEALEIWK